MISTKFTFNQIQEFWNTHTETDAITELSKDSLNLLENIDFHPEPYSSSLLDLKKNRYNSVDCRHCVVLIVNNTLQFHSGWNLSPIMIEDTIGRIGITYSQLALINDKSINQQVECIVKYAHKQQLKCAARIQQITKTVTDVKKMTKDEANEIWIYNRLGFITDEEVDQIWQDGNKICAIALS